MTAKPRVYVSYAGEPERGDSLDGQIVESLRAALEAAGFEFCRDETHLAYGESLTQSTQVKPDQQFF